MQIVIENVKNFKFDSQDESNFNGKILEVKTSTSEVLNFDSGKLIANESEINFLYIDDTFQFDIIHSKILKLRTSLHDNGTVEYSTIGTIQKLKVLRNLSISNSRIDEISSLGIFVLGTLKMENVTIGKINEEGLINNGCTIMKNVTIHTAVGYSIFIGHHCSCNEFKDLTFEEGVNYPIVAVRMSPSSLSNVMIRKRILNDIPILGNLPPISVFTTSAPIITTEEKITSLTPIEPGTNLSVSTPSIDPLIRSSVSTTFIEQVTTSPATISPTEPLLDYPNSTSPIEIVASFSAATSSVEQLAKSSVSTLSIEQLARSSVSTSSIEQLASSSVSTSSIEQLASSSISTSSIVQVKKFLESTSSMEQQLLTKSPVSTSFIQPAIKFTTLTSSNDQSTKFPVSTLPAELLTASSEDYSLLAQVTTASVSSITIKPETISPLLYYHSLLMAHSSQMNLSEKTQATLVASLYDASVLNSPDINIFPSSDSGHTSPVSGNHVERISSAVVSTIGTFLILVLVISGFIINKK